MKLLKHEDLGLEKVPTRCEAIDWIRCKRRFAELGLGIWANSLDEGENNKYITIPTQRIKMLFVLIFKSGVQMQVLESSSGVIMCTYHNRRLLVFMFCPVSNFVNIFYIQFLKMLYQYHTQLNLIDLLLFLFHFIWFHNFDLFDLNRKL